MGLVRLEYRFGLAGKGEQVDVQETRAPYCRPRARAHGRLLGDLAQDSFAPTHPQALDTGRPTCSDCHGTDRVTSTEKTFASFNHTQAFISNHKIAGQPGSRDLRRLPRPVLLRGLPRRQDRDAALAPSWATVPTGESPHRGNYLTLHRIEGRPIPPAASSATAAPTTKSALLATSRGLIMKIGLKVGTFLAAAAVLFVLGCTSGGGSAPSQNPATGRTRPPGSPPTGPATSRTPAPAPLPRIRRGASHHCRHLRRDLLRLPPPPGPQPPGHLERRRADPGPRSGRHGRRTRGAFDPNAPVFPNQGFVSCTPCHGVAYKDADGGYALSCYTCHTTAPHPPKPWGAGPRASRHPAPARPGRSQQRPGMRQVPRPRSQQRHHPGHSRPRGHRSRLLQRHPLPQLQLLRRPNRCPNHQAQDPKGSRPFLQGGARLVANFDPSYPAQDIR